MTSTLNELKDSAEPGLPRPTLSEALICGLGVFITITVLAYITYEVEYPVLIIPLGASTFTVFAAHAELFSQPRNIVGGQVLAALTGVACYKLLGSCFWVAGFSCGAATLLMVVTRTKHPPAAATAIIPVLTCNGEWLWAFCPTCLGAAMIVIMGVIFNNLIKGRKYPAFWW